MKSPAEAEVIVIVNFYYLSDYKETLLSAGRRVSLLYGIAAGFKYSIRSLRWGLITSG